MSEGAGMRPRWIGGIEPPGELLWASGTAILELECRQQPEKLRELLEAYHGNPALRTNLAQLRELAKRPGPVLFIGMGASLCSAISGSTLLQSHGRLSFSLDAGEWLHYAEPLWKQAAASVLLTTSGESAELVHLMQRTEELPVGLICNNEASPCWRLAKYPLPILAGPEYGNATKTYTNATAAAIILASEMMGLEWRQEAANAEAVFSGNMERIFAMGEELEVFCRGAANTEIVGRGAGHGAAVMSALCIREMTGHRAAAHTGAGFRHGPNLDVDATHVAIVFALGRMADAGVKLAAECNRRGGKVVLVSSREQQVTERLLPIRIPEVPEPWEAITSLLVPQALTLAMTERSGCRLPPRFQYGVMEE